MYTTHSAMPCFVHTSHTLSTNLILRSAHLLYMNSLQDSFGDGIVDGDDQGYYTFKYDGDKITNKEFDGVIEHETLGDIVDCPVCPDTTIQSSLMKSGGKLLSPLTGSTLTLIVALNAFLFVAF